MISKSEIDIIVSFFDSGCEFRKKNFNIIKNKLLKLGLNLIVCEQIASKTNKTTIENSDFTHVKYYSSNLFEKSKLYNIAANLSKAKYLWFLDCDVVLPYDEILSIVDDQEFIQPFSKIYNLNKEETDHFLNETSFQLDPNKFDSYLGKYCFIVKKSKFFSSGGFDEKFIGWGWEDLDFIKNKLKVEDYLKPKDVLGFHLYHPKALKENERNNYFVFRENMGNRNQVSFVIDQTKKFNEKKINEFLEFISLYSGAATLHIFINQGFAEDNKIKLIKKFNNHLVNQNLIINYSSIDFKSEKEKKDTFSYWTSGRNICFLDEDFDISVLNLNKIFTTCSFDPSFLCDLYLEKYLLINRAVLDYMNGIDWDNIENFISTIKASESFINKSSLYISQYGVRNQMYYLNLSTNNFDSF